MVQTLASPNLPDELRNVFLRVIENGLDQGLESRVAGLEVVNVLLIDPLPSMVRIRVINALSAINGAGFGQSALCKVPKAVDSITYEHAAQAGVLPSHCGTSRLSLADQGEARGADMDGPGLPLTSSCDRRCRRCSRISAWSCRHPSRSCDGVTWTIDGEEAVAAGGVAGAGAAEGGSEKAGEACGRDALGNGMRTVLT